MKFVMADGRGTGTHFEPDCQMNHNLQEKFGVTDTHEYRQFLQQNAEKIMKENAVPTVEDHKNCPVCNDALNYKPLDANKPPPTVEGIQPWAKDDIYASWSK